MIILVAIVVAVQLEEGAVLGPIAMQVTVTVTTGDGKMISSLDSTLGSR